MKRFIMLAMVLVMMAVSIEGCWIGWDRDDRGGRGGEHERGGEGDRGGGHDSGGEHDRGGGH